MRKRRLGKILALILTASVLCACGAEQTSTDQTKEEDSAASAGNAQESETAVSENTADQQTASGKIKTNIYYSNEMGDGLDERTVEAEKLTPEFLLEQLAQENIVTEDTKANSCTVKEENGQKIVVLDLSEAFGAYASSMGTDGEYVVIAALTDTFLDAYQADSLRLTVEGQQLETGHMLDDWDLTWYQLTSYTIETADYKDGNIAISYPQLVNVHNSYTEEEWNDIFEQYAKKDLEYLDGETSEYTLTYEVATATEDLLSIVYRVSAYEQGAAHPYSYIETFNIDMTSGDGLRLSDFVNTYNVVGAFTKENGYTLVNTELDVKDFQEFVNTSEDLVETDYFEEFDIDYANPDAYPNGYSYKKDGKIILCIEVPHALGDFVEVQLND